VDERASEISLYLSTADPLQAAEELLATKVNIVFYADPADAFSKAILE
jgi:predicted ATP-dependent Lon-type protease